MKLRVKCHGILVCALSILVGCCFEWGMGGGGGLVVGCPITLC